MREKLPLRLLGLTGLLLTTAAMACSAAESEGGSPWETSGTGAGGAAATGTGGAGGGATTTSTSTGDGGGLLGTGGSTGSGQSGCSDEAKNYVYILGQSKELYRFQPDIAALTQIAILDCPGETFGSTFSMAVDRDGTAWVLFADGQIFHVSTTTGACSPSGYVPPPNGAWGFGMGFVADSVGSESETLYLGLPTGLGKLDTTTLTQSTVGAYDTLPSLVAEMTGTGDGRLFGYFTSAGVTLAEIDKTNAHILKATPLPTVPTGTSWAFAFWGGYFWLFNGHEIRRYDEATGVQVINANVGFEIVGAGVSTCAPVAPPR
jgi:hypothetical protein